MSAKPATSTPIKVAIVDDDEGIRSSLAALIKRAPEFRLTRDYSDGESALKDIPQQPPDVIARKRLC